MVFEPGLQSPQDLHRLLDRRLVDIDLLETASQRAVFFEDAAVFLIGGRSDAPQITRCQHRLDEIGRVHHAARRRARADDGVDLVDKQDRVGLALQVGQYRFEALLEVTTILGPRHQSAHIQRIQRAVGQHVRHLAIDDLFRQPLGDRGFADPGLADEQRVVLAPPAQDLDGALDLALAADQRVDLAATRLVVEIARIGLEGAFLATLAALRVAGTCFATMFGGLITRDFRDAMRDVVDDIQAGDVLAIEKIHRLRFLLAEDRDQHIGAGHLFLLRGLHVKNGPLQHPLKAERRLSLAALLVHDQRRGFFEKAADVTAQAFDIGAAGAQYLGRRRIVQQRQQQMFDRHELVLLLPCALERLVEGKFKLFAQHLYSLPVTAICPRCSDQPADRWFPASLTPLPGYTAMDAGWRANGR